MHFVLSLLTVAASSDSIFLVGEFPPYAAKLNYLLGQYNKTSTGEYVSASRRFGENLVLWHEYGWWKASSKANKLGQKAPALTSNTKDTSPTTATAWHFEHEDDGYNVKHPAPNIRCLSGAEGEAELLASVAAGRIYLHGANAARARIHPPLAFSRSDGAGANARLVYSMRGGLRSMWYAKGYWFVGDTKLTGKVVENPQKSTDDTARPVPAAFYYRVEDRARLPEYIDGGWQVWEAKADEPAWKDVPDFRCDGDAVGYDAAVLESLESLRYEITESSASHTSGGLIGGIDTKWSLVRLADAHAVGAPLHNMSVAIEAAKSGASAAHADEMQTVRARFNKLSADHYAHEETKATEESRDAMARAKQRAQEKQDAVLEVKQLTQQAEGKAAAAGNAAKAVRAAADEVKRASDAARGAKATAKTAREEVDRANKAADDAAKQYEQAKQAKRDAQVASDEATAKSQTAVEAAKAEAAALLAAAVARERKANATAAKAEENVESAERDVLEAEAEKKEASKQVQLAKGKKSSAEAWAQKRAAATEAAEAAAKKAAEVTGLAADAAREAIKAAKSQAWTAFGEYLPSLASAETSSNIAVSTPAKVVTADETKVAEVKPGYVMPEEEATKLSATIKAKQAVEGSAKQRVRDALAAQKKAVRRKADAKKDRDRVAIDSQQEKRAAQLARDKLIEDTTAVAQDAAKAAKTAKQASDDAKAAASRASGAKDEANAAFDDLERQLWLPLWVHEHLVAIVVTLLMAVTGSAMLTRSSRTISLVRNLSENNADWEKTALVEELTEAVSKYETEVLEGELKNRDCASLQLQKKKAEVSKMAAHTLEFADPTLHRRGLKAHLFGDDKPPVAAQELKLMEEEFKTHEANCFSARKRSLKSMLCPKCKTSQKLHDTEAARSRLRAANTAAYSAESQATEEQDYKLVLDLESHLCGKCKAVDELKMWQEAFWALRCFNYVRYEKAGDGAGYCKAEGYDLDEDGNVLDERVGWELEDFRKVASERVRLGSSQPTQPTEPDLNRDPSCESPTASPKTSPNTSPNALKKQLSLQAGIRSAHIAAVRVYTTSAFHVINKSLRDKDLEEDGETPRCQRFRITTNLIYEALKLLLPGNPMIQKGDKGGKFLYRGLSRVRVKEDFGDGKDLALFSTTSSLYVALEFALNDPDFKHPLLLRLHTTNEMRGIAIDYLSVYVREKEYLYPPFTTLDRRATEGKDKDGKTIYERQIYEIALPKWEGTFAVTVMDIDATLSLQ